MATKIYRLTPTLLLFTVFMCFFLGVTSVSYAEFNVLTEAYVLTGVNTQITVKQATVEGTLPIQYKITRDNKTVKSGVINQSNIYNFTFALNEAGIQNLELTLGNRKTNFTIKVLPGYLTLIPPLAVFVILILTKHLLFSLFIALISAALIANNFNIFAAFSKTFDTYIAKTLLNPTYLYSIMFIFLAGAFLSVLIATLKIPLTSKTPPKKTLFTTLCLFCTFFFNSIVSIFTIGSLIQPLAEKNKLSNEKLAYLINTAATTIVGLFILSTNLGLELNILTPIIASFDIAIDPYELLYQSIPFKFYSLLTIFFLLAIIVSGKNFGPMLQALKIPSDTPTPKNTSKPLLIVISISIIISLLFLIALTLETTQTSPSIAQTVKLAFTANNTLKPLTWLTAFLSIIVFIFAILRKTLTAQNFANIWLQGIKKYLVLILTLLLTWTLSDLCVEIKMPYFLASSLNNGLPHWLLPAISFIIAFVIAIATGSIQATIAIMLPISLPLAYHQSLQYYNLELASLVHPPALFGFVKAALLLNLAAIYEGSLFGIHCSPIAATTILTSQVTKINILKHLKTQTPYTVLLGLLAILFCYLPAGLGFSPYLLIAVSIMVIVTLIFTFGKDKDKDTGGSQTVPLQEKSQNNQPTCRL